MIFFILCTVPIHKMHYIKGYLFNLSDLSSIQERTRAYKFNWIVLQRCVAVFIYKNRILEHFTGSVDVPIVFKAEALL